MSSPVITRFAPSPTGYLHIGGARTALFNWAYARRHGGNMLLRIEDTDRERSTAAAIDAILEGLTWLGLDWAGEAVSQYGRVERHREVAELLLAQGKAYRCFCTQEELEAMRARAEAEKRPIRYDGTWRDRDPSEGPVGVKPTIRFKAPLAGETVGIAGDDGHIDDIADMRVAIFQMDRLQMRCLADQLPRMAALSFEQDGRATSDRSRVEGISLLIQQRLQPRQALALHRILHLRVHE